ncbi:MAG: ATP synthase F1 subunit delta [Thermoguttaceae bacterium]|jgi:F-type H+-transporting ATPase subunit delta
MAESQDPTARHARAAAKLSPDVGAERIGEVYATALLGAARTAGQTAAVLEELDALIDEVLREHPRLEAVLSSPLVRAAEKADVLDRVFGGRVTPLVLHFLKVVARHGRLDCLRAIRREARRKDEEARRRIHVRVSTAVALGLPELDRIRENLRGLIGGELVLEPAVDPELIGGAVLRIDDTVYDGSVLNQLQRVRQQMIERSVHEIQSRRDRFRHTAGS